MITINIYYSGKENAAEKFAEEMENSGLVDRIRAQEGNMRYEYFKPLDDEDTILLIDSWKDQKAIDEHHKSEMMQEIIKLREKYDLHMKVERFVSQDIGSDSKYIRE